MAYIKSQIMVTRMGILKFLCLTVLFAFVSQVFIARAEHTGLVECHAVCSESGEKIPSPKKPIKDTALSLHCCCSTIAAPSLADFTWNACPHTKLSFHIHDEVIPDGPAKAIDIPPQLLSSCSAPTRRTLFLNKMTHKMCVSLSRMSVWLL